MAVEMTRKPRESEIIIKMRIAIDLLKQKYREESGSWFLLDVMDAQGNEDAWIRKIAEAERLSDPYMPENYGK